MGTVFPRGGPIPNLTHETVTGHRVSESSLTTVLGNERRIEALGSASVNAGAPMVSARGIHKRFGRKVVLEDAYLEVRAGEVVALVGENGAGKTTLLRICAGLLPAEAGDVYMGGRIGYCPQEPGVFELLTADEHLVLFGRAIGLDRKTALAEGRAILEGFDFPVDERTVARALSEGTRQKLNVALALLGDPKVLLLDEPYQGFDRGTYVSGTTCTGGATRAGRWWSSPTCWRSWTGWTEWWNSPSNRSGQVPGAPQRSLADGGRLVSRHHGRRDAGPRSGEASPGAGSPSRPSPRLLRGDGGT